jgi:hypothetical protein
MLTYRNRRRIRNYGLAPYWSRLSCVRKNRSHRTSRVLCYLGNGRKIWLCTYRNGKVAKSINLYLYTWMCIMTFITMRTLFSFLYKFAQYVRVEVARSFPILSIMIAHAVFVVMGLRIIAWHQLKIVNIQMLDRFWLPRFVVSLAGMSYVSEGLTILFQLVVLSTWLAFAISDAFLYHITTAWSISYNKYIHRWTEAWDGRVMRNNDCCWFAPNPKDYWSLELIALAGRIVRKLEMLWISSFHFRR